VLVQLLEALVAGAAAFDVFPSQLDQFRLDPFGLQLLGNRMSKRAVLPSFLALALMATTFMKYLLR